MKKLLLIGAMLIVGATSFSAVSFDLTETQGQHPNPNTYSGTGTLPIDSEGVIIDSTGKAILVLSAIDSSGTNGRELTFNFGSVPRGQEQTLIGKFKAEVFENNVQKSLNGATISVELEKGNKKANAVRFEVDSTKNDTANAGKKLKLVHLSYELSKSNGLSQDGKQYNGEIRAVAFRPEHNAQAVPDHIAAGTSYTTGQFFDNSVNLIFNIKNLGK